MATFLFNRCRRAQWLGGQDRRRNSEQQLGVVLRKTDGTSIFRPETLSSTVRDAVDRLAAPVAITMSSDITEALLQILTPFQTDIQLSSALTLPVVQSVVDIALPTSGVTSNTFACVCRRESMLLLWSSSVQTIMDHAADVEMKLLSMLWGEQVPKRKTSIIPRFSQLTSGNFFSRKSWSNGSTAPRMPAKPARAYVLDDTTKEKMAVGVYDEKVAIIEAAINKETEGDKVFDPEKDGLAPPKRPFLLNHAISVAVAMTLVVIVEMACVAKLLQETRLDGKYIRWALLATVPIFAAFSMFFMIVLSGSVFQLFGPMGSLNKNSTYYSAIPPKPGRYVDTRLPHITIQMPVYKEGLQGVIIPTITSVMKAVEVYRAAGGTASIFVNDDGMQLVTPELAKARQAFYDVNGIGWVARPRHCEEEGEFYFLRKGQFKKASNMNYCMDFSIRVEDKMIELIDAACHSHNCQRHELPQGLEETLYKEAFTLEIERDNGNTWAGGDIRIGDVILIIDSDTRVPQDSLLYGALEMHESPEVALIQHASGILQVAHNVFENGITYFTNLIYTSIQFAVGSGDCAPFVGHNTFIRWKAIQSVAFEEDGVTKFWSDSHVSEDFDLSLRLQMAGFVVRLATYHKGGFKEGVSLTVYDELARWEKYAYGCNELVFHPLIRWPRHGPLTPLFRRFLWSNIKITSKMTILAYIGTYYAIASALPLSLANYFLLGWFPDSIDQYYNTSWKIFVGMAVVFNVLSPIAYAMLRHRLGHAPFFKSILESLKWAPMFLLFFGGISFHLFKALLCHFFSIKMEWTTTAKELEASGFRVGLDRVVRDFKGMYMFLLPLTGAVIYLALGAPRGWMISDFTLIVPLANQVACHTLLPFALGLF